MYTEVTPTPLVPLSADERRALLRLARDSIRAALRGEQPPAADALTAALCEPTAVFVSLHLAQRLRGCLGTLVAERPLHEAVTHVARAAAFEDRRFPPLTEAELTALAIEISRLSPLAQAFSEQVRPGSHGVCLRCGDRSAVFLPQVATQYGWDRQMLLSELCRKAMLPPDAWKRSDASLEIFTAEVFSDDVER